MTVPELGYEKFSAPMHTHTDMYTDADILGLQVYRHTLEILQIHTRSPH